MTHDDRQLSERTPATPQPPVWRVLYFRIAQGSMMLLALSFALSIVTLSDAALLFVMYKPMIVLTRVIVVNAVLSAIVGAWRPDLPAARPAVALYALAGLIWFAVWADGEWKDHRRDRIRDLESAAMEGRWEEFEDRLYPWLRSMRDDGFVYIGNACMRGQSPPVRLFARVAEDTELHPTLRTLVAATCGAEHTRWALANGGSVVPKHHVAPSPLAFARDDEVFALLLEAGATLDQRDPEYPKGPTPLFYAYDAANVRRLHAAGADMFATDELGGTALHTFEWFNCRQWCLSSPPRGSDSPRLRQLLESGLNPNYRDTDGRTPLFHYHSNINAIRILLEGGADPDARDKQGKAAIDSIAIDVVVQLRSEGLIAEPVDRDALAPP